MTTSHADYFLVGQENNNILILGGFLGVITLGTLMLGMTHQEEIRVLTMVPGDEHARLEKRYEDAQQALRRLQGEQTLLEGDKERLAGQVDQIKSALKGEQEKARTREVEEEVIRFSELDGNHFESGSAELSRRFVSNIRNQVVPKVSALLETHRDLTVEVFGFTDGVPLGMRDGCSMDRQLVSFNHGRAQQAPVSCSNADLGLLRATSVARQIRQILDSGQTKVPGRSIRVLAYTAGQTLLPDGTLADAEHDGREDQSRRFVDVRFSLK